jgi:uncharacterized protein (TIGR02466 family)
MNQRTIFPLFSTPVYIHNVGDFEKPDLNVLEYSSKAPTGEAFHFLSSTDKNVLDRPEFGNVRGIVMQEIEFYAREIFVVSKNIEFYVTNSWVNVYRRGEQAGAHMHHNSLISGVLYLQAADTGGDIVFHRETQTLVPFPPTLDLDMDSFNIYNCKSWGYRPKTNDICLFPSVLSHSVEPNGSDAPRSSLAFNVFVRGEIGAMHKLRLR